MTKIEEPGTWAGTETNTTGLAFDVAGAGDPQMLFLHGWCGDRSFFAPQFDHFRGSHRVVSVDLPGHGASKAPAAYTIEALATAVAAVTRQPGLGRGVAIGHSLGAMVALELTRQAPELVDAVIMFDPPPLSQEVWKGFAGELLPAFQGPDAAAGRRKFVEQMFLPTDDADRRAQIIKLMCGVPSDVAVGMVKAMAAFDGKQSSEAARCRSSRLRPRCRRTARPSCWKLTRRSPLARQSGLVTSISSKFPSR
jgi:pimeloyl-ACP methyl ester carboxylesterase